MDWRFQLVWQFLLFLVFHNMITINDGYTNGEGFLAPYRGKWYHLQEWGTGLYSPQGRENLFNYRHAWARNVIEWCFGLLKRGWDILRTPSFYPIKTKCRIILACCLLHNVICMNMTMNLEEFSPFIEDDVPLGEETFNVVGTIEPNNQRT